MAIQNSPAAFRFAGDALRGNPTVAGLAAKLDPLNLEFVAENLKVPWGKKWGLVGNGTGVAFAPKPVGVAFAPKPSGSKLF